MVACTTAGLWVEDDDLGFIGVSRTSSVLGGSRTRLVLGGEGLGGDDRACVGDDRAWLGWWRRWVRSHQCWDATSPVLDRACCFSLSLLFS